MIVLLKINGFSFGLRGLIIFYETHYISQFGVEKRDLPAQHRALTSTPFNSFGMNWNND